MTTVKRLNQRGNNIIYVNRYYVIIFVLVEKTQYMIRIKLNVLKWDTYIICRFVKGHG